MRTRAPTSRQFTPSWLRATVAVCGAAALVSLALEFGFYDPPLPVALLLGVQLTAVVLYTGFRIYTVLVAADRWRALKACWIDGLVVLGAALGLLVWFEASATPVLKLSAVYVATIQFVLIVRLAIEAIRLNLLLSRSGLHPTRLLVLTFVGLIVLGTLALSLPRATRVNRTTDPSFSMPRHILNCALTATSATCVTGLVVYDTGSDFTMFGQAVLLILIQAGGLGIMIFGSAFGLMAQRQLSLRQSLVMQDSISHRTLGDLRTMIVFIVLFTFTAEAIGAAMIYPMWTGALSDGSRLFHSVFHSVSAFCNAGFALQSDSLVQFNRTWQVYGCLMPLIVMGGLGFPVLHDLWQGILARMSRWWHRRDGVSLDGGRGRRHRLKLHTKLVLITSTLLIVMPAALFVVFESFGRSQHSPFSSNGVSGYSQAEGQSRPTAATGGGRYMKTENARAVGVATGQDEATTMAGASISGRLLDAVFYSVTCRTAGFNTTSMDVESLSSASHFLACLLMFIGGSPGSTAGGVKTIAVTVLALGAWTLLRGRRHVEVMGRTIPDEVVRRAGVVVMVMFGVVSVVTLLLLVTEGASLRETLFEAVSACGTVGLTTGLTSDLTVPGRIVIMAAMFAGRLGPLTLLIALAGRATTSRYEYPTEHVGIG